MNPQLSFHQALTAWKYAVVGKSAGPWPGEMAASSYEEFENWQAQLAATKIEANKKGYTCQFNKGGSKSGRVAAWVVANGNVFKIVFQAKAKRPQAVTQTSRNAYHTIDFETSRGQVAQAIFEYTVMNGLPDVTRKEIEVWQRMGCNQVTGRVKELLEMSEKAPFVFGGTPYRLQVVSVRLSKCDGASDKVNEGLRWVAAGVQASLFQ